MGENRSLWKFQISFLVTKASSGKHSITDDCGLSYNAGVLPDHPYYKRQNSPYYKHINFETAIWVEGSLELIGVPKSNGELPFFIKQTVGKNIVSLLAMVR